MEHRPGRRRNAAVRPMWLQGASRGLAARFYKTFTQADANPERQRGRLISVPPRRRGERGAL
jgi:hypothetical protein